MTGSRPCGRGGLDSQTKIMLFDLRQVHGERAHVQRTFDVAAFEPADPDYRVAAPVHLSMDVEKSIKDVYRVTGQVTTRLELECGRCLEPYEIPVDAPFELRYVPLAESVAEGDREIAEDDLTTAFYADGVIDVLQLLREQFQLALPMKPLCSDACRGLCVVCGNNLNRTACNCTPVWEDPRLAALKGLLDRQKEN
jgi:uncharacterized protein